MADGPLKRTSTAALKPCSWIIIQHVVEKHVRSRDNYARAHVRCLIMCSSAPSQVNIKLCKLSCMAWIVLERLESCHFCQECRFQQLQGAVGQVTEVHAASAFASFTPSAVAVARPVWQRGCAGPDVPRFCCGEPGRQPDSSCLGLGPGSASRICLASRT